MCWYPSLQSHVLEGWGQTCITPRAQGEPGRARVGQTRQRPAAQGRLRSEGIQTREEGVSSKGQEAGEAQTVGCWRPAAREARGLGTGGQGLLCVPSPWDLILSSARSH